MDRSSADDGFVMKSKLFLGQITKLFASICYYSKRDFVIYQVNISHNTRGIPIKLIVGLINRTADQRHCFRYTDSTISRLLKSEISSF